MARVCTSCANCYMDGNGYSDWTWLDTEVICFLKLNPDFPADEPSDLDGQETRWKPNLRAVNCESFVEISGDIVTLSPEGETSGDKARIAFLEKLIPSDKN